MATRKFSWVGTCYHPNLSYKDIEMAVCADPRAVRMSLVGPKHGSAGDLTFESVETLEQVVTTLREDDRRP